jgi:molybdenum cofactor cytidylyltransferase
MKIGAILLASGLSRRMGEINKMTLTVGGKPMLRHMAETLVESNLASIHAVIGFEEAFARSALSGLDVTLVENPHYEEGQMTSVHAGLRSVQGKLDAVMVCLADQALLTSTDINQLLAQYEQGDQQRILVPTWQGQRGNPIIIPADQVNNIVSGQRNLGCKRLIEKKPELTQAYEMPNDHVVFDVDCTEDYQQLIKRLALRSSALVA